MLPGKVFKFFLKDRLLYPIANSLHQKMKNMVNMNSKLKKHKKKRFIPAQKKRKLNQVSPEVIFAQKLAANDPTIRNRYGFFKKKTHVNERIYSCNSVSLTFVNI